jgi:hypothetical protein
LVTSGVGTAFWNTLLKKNGGEDRSVRTTRKKAYAATGCP